MAPERDAERVETNPLAVAGTQELAIDGTERRRQRPQDAARQTAHYSGKQRTHTDKNLLLVNETTRQVIYLSPTVAGTRHDKRAADEVQMTYPTNATLDGGRSGAAAPRGWWSERGTGARGRQAAVYFDLP
jgi:hypothetical protein